TGLVLGAAEVQDAFGQRGFARVNVSDDANIPQFFEHGFVAGGGQGPHDDRFLPCKQKRRVTGSRVPVPRSAASIINRVARLPSRFRVSKPTLPLREEEAGAILAKACPVC